MKRTFEEEIKSLVESTAREGMWCLPTVLGAVPIDVEKLNEVVERRTRQLLEEYDKETIRIVKEALGEKEYDGPTDDYYEADISAMLAKDRNDMRDEILVEVKKRLKRKGKPSNE